MNGYLNVVEPLNDEIKEASTW